MSKREICQSCPTASVQEPESWPQPQAEPQVRDEEDEIKALLWPFVNDKGSETLQEMQALSVNFHKQDREGMDPMPNNQLLQPPSQVLQTSAANQPEEEQNMEQEKGEEDVEMPSGASKQKKTKSGGATKKPMKKRDVDDDSWMPEGWVKQVNQRPFKGKFPGYNDKKYYAPGVSRAFRSKIEALRYIEKLRNAAATGSSVNSVEVGHEHGESPEQNIDILTNSANELMLISGSD